MKSLEDVAYVAASAPRERKQRGPVEPNRRRKTNAMENEELAKEEVENEEKK